jgi:hypothetical protein
MLIQERSQHEILGAGASPVKELIDIAFFRKVTRSIQQHHAGSGTQA